MEPISVENTPSECCLLISPFDTLAPNIRPERQSFEPMGTTLLRRAVSLSERVSGNTIPGVVFVRMEITQSNRVIACLVRWLSSCADTLLSLPFVCRAAPIKRVLFSHPCHEHTTTSSKSIGVDCACRVLVTTRNGASYAISFSTKEARCHNQAQCHWNHATESRV